MKMRNYTRDIEWVYSHITSEIYMKQYTFGYKLFAVCDCSEEAGALPVSEELAARFAQMGKRQFPGKRVCQLYYRGSRFK